MDDCRQHLLFSGGIAFAFGGSQANYLWALRLHLERLIWLLVVHPQKLSHIAAPDY
jgi:hypothetical protein